MTTPQINFFEELGLNAWPASHTIVLDGWLLRFNDGYTQRANSVNPVYPGEPAATLEKINLCEGFYTSMGLPTVFKMTAASHPADLDEILQSQGYAKKGLTAVQTVELAGLETLFQSSSDIGKERAEVRLIVEDTLHSDWLKGWLELDGISSNKRVAVEKILENILPAHCFVRLEQAGQTLAMGLAVCEHQHVGLFSIVTNREFRRQGWGKRLALELLRWGQQQGAATGYLQVALDNVAALSLYTSLGFRESYQYWYRVKPLVKS